MKGTKVKNSKGITLVALVITIIILLILAVVAINAVNGDGIIGKAKEARQNYTEAADEEQAEITRQVGLIEDALGIEKPAEGVKVSDILIRDAKNGLLYKILDDTAKTVEVYGDRGDIDYTAGFQMGNTMIYNWISANVITTGNVKIPKNVKVEEDAYTVISIGKNAFPISTITEITIPDTVTALDTNCFSFCQSLSTVNIPSSVLTIEDTNLPMIIFANCQGLKSINVDSNNPNYCSIDGVLYNKEKTSLLCYPQLKEGNYSIPNNVTEIKQGAFIWCRGLNSITIPSNIIIMQDTVFSGWTSNQKIKVYWSELERPTGWNENWNSNCVAEIIYKTTE